jgi:hypothetical protein
MHTCMHTYIRACMHTYILGRVMAGSTSMIHACMYACMHACMHAHTHTCTHTDRALGRALAGNTTVTSLRLGFNRLGSLGVEVMAEALLVRLAALALPLHALLHHWPLTNTCLSLKLASLKRWPLHSTGALTAQASLQNSSLSHPGLSLTPAEAPL